MTWRDALYWTTHVLATPVAIGGLLTAAILLLVVLRAVIETRGGF